MPGSARSLTPAAYLALVAVLASVPCGAEAATVVSLYTAGSWQVFSGVGDDRRAFCEISSGGAGGRRVLVLQLAGDPNLTLQLIKDGWTIPEQTPIDVVFDIDGTRWPFHTTGAGQLVGVEMPPDAAAGFAQRFRAGHMMTVSFPSGSEAPWSGSLSSSNAVFNAFERCRQTLIGQTTQPFATPTPVAPATTQPFPTPAVPPAPTSPADAPSQPANAPAGLPPIPPASSG